MDPLTPRQAEILQFIREAIESTGMPPTRAEIAQHLGFRSISTAVQHLKALARKGAIELRPDASRGIVLKHGPGLPLIGRVAAGRPILAEEHIERYYRVDPKLFKPRADYLLRVYGNSMAGVGILEGDLIAVHRTEVAESEQIVVARIEDEVTIKRFRRRGAKVELVAENPDFEPIRLDLRRTPLVIEGVYVGLVRQG
jgi:repressor LexA